MEWISVKDDVPKYINNSCSDWVLIYSKDRRFRRGDMGRLRTGVWDCSHGDSMFVIDYVTHWSPLLADPK